MNNRTMVKIRCSKDLLVIRTVSWERKSPHWFSILRSEMRQLEEKPECRLISVDGGSFAALRLMKTSDRAQMLEIRFTWLQGDGADRVKGWTETVRLSYARIHTFVEAGEDMDDTEWRQLAMPEQMTHRIEFRSRKNLHVVAGCPILRHKLGKFLDRHFRWNGTEKIVIYDDFLPYSFFFEEHTPHGMGICGDIILHDAENLQKAQYSIHT